MRRKSDRLTLLEINRIIQLLKIDDLRFYQIGIRMNCSKGAVQDVNEKYGVRPKRIRRAA